jgi:hypothetical protein
VRSRLPGVAGFEDALGFNPLTLLAESLRSQAVEAEDDDSAPGYDTSV